MSPSPLFSLIYSKYIATDLSLVNLTLGVGENLHILYFKLSLSLICSNFCLLFPPALPINFYHYSFILISKPIIPLLFFSLAVKVSIYFKFIIYFNIADLKALIGVFYQHHSLNDLITYRCLHASIKYLNPDYSHNYPMILKLCFSAFNNSRIILAKMSTYNSPKLCRHIRLKPISNTGCTV